LNHLVGADLPVCTLFTWADREVCPHEPGSDPMAPASTDVKRKAADASKSVMAGPLSAEELRKMDAYWRAANYLSVGQIYTSRES
jgi:XFP N-terminal domain